MRITNNMLISHMMNSLNQNLQRMEKIQTQLSTGKKITVPSDDPLVASKALKFRSDVSEIDQYLKNVDDSLSWAEMTDTTLSSVGDVIQRARELAVQGSSDSLDAGQRDNIKAEVEQLYTQLIKLGNTSFAGRYIFSGFKTDKPLLVEKAQTFNYTDVPVLTDGANFRLMHDNITAMTNVKGDVGGVPTTFTMVPGPPAAGEVQVDMATGQLTFNAADIAAGITSPTATYSLDRVKGDYNPDSYSYTNIAQTSQMENEDIKYEIGIGDKISVNVIGSKIFKPANGTSNAGDHIMNFGKFINALGTNNTAGIQAAIADMDNFMDSILEQRANVGAKSNRLDLTNNRLTSQQTNITDLMSKNEDADIAQVIMNLKNEENVYKSSLDVGARIIQPTLLDFLR